MKGTVERYVYGYPNHLGDGTVSRGISWFGEGFLEPTRKVFNNKVQGVPCPRRLGFVDLYLRSSPGWWAATVATYCPRRIVEHPKSKSTQPRSTRTINH